MTPSSPAVGLKTPPTFESKTPPAFGQGAPTSVFASSSNPFSKDSTNKKKDQDKAKHPSTSNTSSATPPVRIVQRNADKSPTSHKDANSNNDRKKVEKIKEQLRKEREKSVATTSPNISSSATDVDPNEKPRKIFPELPVTKCDGDKLEQHKDDYAATKRRLEEARARKMADIYRKKEIERLVKILFLPSIVGE